MQIQEYSLLPEDVQLSVLSQMGEADWRGARFLRELLLQKKLTEYSGDHPRLLLLMDGEQLVSMCTLSSRDEIHVTQLRPWIGFVYTAPSYRGQHRSGLLIDHACFLAKEQGYTSIYLSSDEYGLYEKYGFRLIGHLPNVRNTLTQVFERKL